MDLTEINAPKSDQLNAEDLLSGPRTFTIRDVRRGASPEQPIDVEMVEFPGRPWRPNKTNRRILVAAWGPESDVYAGRRLTLYRDPTIRFGKDEVGGIRVSHLSHINRQIKLALTVTRGKRAAHTVDPLPDTAPAAPPIPEGRIAPGRLKAIVDGLEHLGISEPADKLDAVKAAVGRDIASARDLTADEGATVLAWIAGQADTPDEPPPAEEPSEPLWPAAAQPPA